MIKIRHVAINVRDIDKSLAFYRDVLGLEYVRTRNHEAFQAVGLTDGETNLALLSLGGQTSRVKRAEDSFGLDHIGFLIDDINYIYNKLKDAKVKFLTQAPADFFKVEDPDGVVVDIASTSRGW